MDDNTNTSINFFERLDSCIPSCGECLSFGCCACKDVIRKNVSETFSNLYDECVKYINLTTPRNEKKVIFRTMMLCGIDYSAVLQLIYKYCDVTEVAHLTGTMVEFYDIATLKSMFGEYPELISCKNPMWYYKIVQTCKRNSVSDEDMRNFISYAESEWHLGPPPSDLFTLDEYVI